MNRIGVHAIWFGMFAASLAIVSGSRAADHAVPSAEPKHYYLPDAGASKIVTVAKQGGPALEIVVLTEAVAVKETGPAETVKKFGEVYGFAPAFIAIRREQPTMLTFWNLQPDDEHDFMLGYPGGMVLMHLKLTPLSKTSYVFTFHREGIFSFYCAAHQPEMNGQILVLPTSKTE